MSRWQLVLRRRAKRNRPCQVRNMLYKMNLDTSEKQLADMLKVMDADGDGEVRATARLALRAPSAADRSQPQ